MHVYGVEATITLCLKFSRTCNRNRRKKKIKRIEALNRNKNN